MWLSGVPKDTLMRTFWRAILRMSRVNATLSLTTRNEKGVQRPCLRISQ